MITLNILLAFALFAIVATSSPGPSNMLALASGANVGFRRSLPLVFGLASGVSMLLLCVGLGLGAVFLALPWLYEILRYAGAGYLAYLAWRISQSGPMNNSATDAAPLGFIGGAAFQWINPKTWVVTISAVSTFVPQQNFTTNVVIIASLLGLTAAFSVSLWAAFGSGLRKFLSDPNAARWFNYTMALALIASIIPILMS